MNSKNRFRFRNKTSRRGFLMFARLCALLAGYFYLSIYQICMWDSWEPVDWIVFCPAIILCFPIHALWHICPGLSPMLVYGCTAGYKAVSVAICLSCYYWFTKRWRFISGMIFQFLSVVLFRAWMFAMYSRIVDENGYRVLRFLAPVSVIVAYFVSEHLNRLMEVKHA